MENKIISDISFTFIRHGDASKGREDKLRTLSHKGFGQAKKCGDYLRKFPPFDLVVTSSASRTKETAREILEQLNISPKTIEVSEIYLPEDKPTRNHVEALLDELGSKSLKHYIDQDLENAWETYAKSAFNVFLEEITKYKPKRVLIVGHGNIINSLGLLIAPTTEELLDVYFNNCEGFEITSSGFVNYIRP